MAGFLVLCAPGVPLCPAFALVLSSVRGPWWPPPASHLNFPTEAPLTSPPGGRVVTQTLSCFASLLGSFRPLRVHRGVHAHGPLGCLEPVAGSQLWDGDATSAGGDPAQPLALSGL